MFTVSNSFENGFPIIILQNKSNSTSAKINLEQGGRLQTLKVNNTILIEDQSNFTYKNSYASAILFPFVNRIKDAKYSFDGNEYQFENNENKSTNALHGLVYNKKFKFLEKGFTGDKCSICISYTETKKSKGFPYKYSIFLTYTLSEKKISLKIKVKNEDEKTFPFTLGWHPYFTSTNLEKSSLSFKSNKKVLFDNHLITKEIIDFKTASKFKLENKQLDDCFVMKDNKVQFSTPDYDILLSSNIKENFLQLYTPKNIPVIAIEPMTGVSDSFNNKIGLQELGANKTYALTWTLKLF